MDKIIKIENVSFGYTYSDENKKKLAVKNLNIEIKKGELVAVLGHNGSGKSTLAKLLNAQILPTNEGNIEIFGMNTRDSDNLWSIREKCAMVFQNPDNQLVATIVEEDVAFGPENLGVEPKDIEKRVEKALKIVEMSEFKKHAPHMLSGGQKQRIAIAGVLAMEPEIIVFDESTAMLDPTGREEIMNTILKLNKEEDKTILYITHYMEEAVLADRVIIINEGEIVVDDSPKRVFSDYEGLRNLGLNVPQVTELCCKLKVEGFKIDTDILNNDEMIEFVERKWK